MGDASQTGSSNKSRFRSQVIIEGQQVPSLEKDNFSELERISILYTHSEDNSGLARVPNGQVVCRTLEELLSFLESDLVDSLWFDETVSNQEKNYISGWARIFRPGVNSQRVQEKIAN